MRAWGYRKPEVDFVGIGVAGCWMSIGKRKKCLCYSNRTQPRLCHGTKFAEPNTIAECYESHMRSY